MTVLLGAGGAAAAYLAFLQPEPEAPTPHALPAPFPTPTAGPEVRSPSRSRSRTRSSGASTATRSTTGAGSTRRPPRCAARSCAIWRRKAPALLEFPPVMSNGSLFQLADNGQLRSMHKKNGKTRWQKKLGRLAASSPALDKRPDLRDAARRRAAPAAGGSSRCSSATGTGAGRGCCRAAASPRRWCATGGCTSAPRTGRSTASARAPARSSGPTTRAARSRAARPTPTASCSSATTAATCRPSAPPTATASGSAGGMGRVYATAAVAYGRVFIGSLDGRVYAFSTRNGHRRWSHTTGGYVYASAGRQPREGVRRLLRRALLRARARRAAACAGPTTPAAGSPARRR